MRQISSTSSIKILPKNLNLCVLRHVLEALIILHAFQNLQIAGGQSEKENDNHSDAANNHPSKNILLIDDFEDSRQLRENVQKIGAPFQVADHSIL